ncbi:hypothetical protein BDK51DRAFT_40468 [Blyttiomyces helicus]|uniref:Uncharacterized protein n=1 Tax=Blyttiomyces helicus TaxID=388810 RepID=A0A4P9W3A0_9FUNG|nr:hypothetical protein BDK51DRAFT_40468 [Blyttiomyces helicus]|eukprot:RKO85825.1 hypothetical protein BDK51DRAFT_40468 [Blyttiomyces helicus]
MELFPASQPAQPLDSNLAYFPPVHASFISTLEGSTSQAEPTPGLDLDLPVFSANELDYIPPGFWESLNVVAGGVERAEVQSARLGWNLAPGYAAPGELGTPLSPDQTVFDHLGTPSDSGSLQEFPASPQLGVEPTFDVTSSLVSTSLTWEGPSLPSATSDLSLPTPTLTSPHPRPIPSPHFSLTRSRQIVEEGACTNCSTPLATLILHGTPETVAVPHTMTLVCLMCDVGAHGPAPSETDAGPAQASGRKRFVAAGPTTTVQCDLCRRPLGYGGMRLGTRFELAARDDWLEPGFDTEVLCLPCGKKYQHCSGKNF